MGRKIIMTGKNAQYIEHRGVNATPDNDREIRMEGDEAVYQEYAYGQAIDWVKVTNDFELSRIRDVVETLGKNNEVKKAIVKAIYDAEADTGNISRIPYSVDKLLGELYQQYDEEHRSLSFAKREESHRLGFQMKQSVAEYMEKHPIPEDEDEEKLMGSLGFGSFVLEKYEVDSDGKKRTVNQTILNPAGSKHITQQFLDTDGNRVLYQLKNSEKEDADMRLSREYFAGSVCDDGSLSLLLIRILREYILPKISTKTKHSNYTWGHLYHTLDALGLALHFKSDKDKARVLYSVYEKNGVSLNTIHCAIKNKTLPKGIYTEWDESDTDRGICSQIAEWLKPVMDSKSIAEVKTKINF